MRSEMLHHAAGSLAAKTGQEPASPEEIIDALGMAWATFTLYENPRAQEAFTRAIETLGNCPHYPWYAEASVDGFLVEGKQVPVRREGSGRLAKRIFGLGTAALELSEPPSADDLIQLFTMLAITGTVEDPTDRLRAAGVRSIALLDRELLLSGEVEMVADPGLKAATDGSPEAFALGLLEGGDADPREVAARFVAEYERVHGLLDPGDTWGVEEVVHAFVDGFWYLPGEYRGAIFGLLLERRDRSENTAFLDQLGGLELVELNRLFGPAGHPLLAEYVRVAAEEGGRHRDDLTRLLSEPESGAALTAKIVNQVASVLRASGPHGTRPADGAIARLQTGRPGAADGLRSATNAVRTLFRLADDAEGVARSSKIWAGRMAAALAAGELEAAETWLGSLAGLDLDDSTRISLAALLSEQLDTDAVDTLAGLLNGPPPEGPGAALRRAAPLFAAPGLIRELSSERAAARREWLLGALAAVAGTRPSVVIPHLNDARWFVVRDALLALASSRRPEVAGPISDYIAHRDPRVRIEVLRSLHRLSGTGATEALLEGILDADESVRKTAERLLSSLEDRQVDLSLIARLEAGHDLEARLRIIDVLGRRGTQEARAALAAIARHRLSFRPARRKLGRAACGALRSCRD